MIESNNFPDLSNELMLPEYKGQAKTTKSGRRYLTPSGNKLPSVSTVMGYDPEKTKKLDAWRKRVGVKNAASITAQSSKYGSTMHDALDYYLENDMEKTNKLYESADFTPQIMFRKIKEFVDKNVEGVYYREKAVYSETLGIAGRFDCLCKIHGIPTIMDFKNSRKPKKLEWVHGYKLQATAYAEMVREHSGVEIKYFVIPVACFNGDLQVFTGKVADYRDEMIEQIYKYYDEVL